LKHLSKNLHYLRESKGLKQAEIKAAIGIERTTWNNYETGVSNPNLEGLVSIAKYFGVSEHDLLHTDLKKLAHPIAKKSDTEKTENRTPNITPNSTPNVPYVPNEAVTVTTSEDEPYTNKIQHITMPRVVTVDNSGAENILYVPIKARAGYLQGYGDPVFVETLPTFSMPGFTNNSYRAFEVDGLSMFSTLHDRDMVIARWERVSEIKDDRVYVIVTANDGVLIKRLINRFKEGVIVCKSDNNHQGEYPAIVINIHDIKEAWYVVCNITRQLSRPGEVYKRLVTLEADVELLKRSLKGK
jgi:transcriptional regulator with XRE-family HTH domain